MKFDLGIPRWLARVLKAVLGLKKIENKYARVQKKMAYRGSTFAADFAHQALQELGVSCALPSEQIARLRNIAGPLIFVANHPFGALDALGLFVLMGAVRDEKFKFVGNAILDTIPEISRVLLPMHIMQKSATPHANISALRNIARYLKHADGAIGIFPAGEVAALPSWRAKKTAERRWNHHVGWLAQHTQATVIPVFFAGQNSRVFQYAGLLFPPLRIALLAREMLRYQKPLMLRIGEPITASQIKSDVKALTIQFRAAVFKLLP